MYAVRLVGTNKWIQRTPGHSVVVDDAGSTWSIPPKNIQSFYNEGVLEHVMQVESTTSSDAAAKAFYANVAKYLEVVQVKFEVIP